MQGCNSCCECACTAVAAIAAGVTATAATATAAAAATSASHIVHAVHLHEGIPSSNSKVNLNVFLCLFGCVTSAVSVTSVTNCLCCFNGRLLMLRL
jgi:hypothetical protein